MGIKNKYDAFISYRHVSPDKEIAEKLQKKLENYTPPKTLRSSKKRGGWRIFRDETELPTSSNLSNDIKIALERSQFLIVICSKTTKDSRWCMEEIEYFKELHNGSNANIITLIADGDPKDVFPVSLCNELIPVTDEHGNTTYQNHSIEPLAANVAAKTLKDSLKKLNTEFLRIAAPILGCGYDNLYNREHKKRIRRIFTIGSIVIALLLLFGIYNSAMLWEINNQKVALAAANGDLQRKTDELNQSNLNLQKSNKELAEKTKEAEANLDEANKQKQVAAVNLDEAEKQRKLAEQNLTEANKQKKIAEDNLDEANKQKQAAETNLAEAEKQRKLAEQNLSEANKQKKIAEDNLKEANKQKQAAETNLTEAEKQRKLAEQNFTEANKQKKIAEKNLDEANKQKQAAETNLAEAEKQRKLAEQNLNEANKQKQAAEANFAEAQKQKKIAEDNLTEANRQQAIAEANAKDANAQRKIAEENMRIAQENEAAAKEATKKVKAKTSEVLANQAQIYLEADNISAAIKTALEALSLIEDSNTSNAIAENALLKATGAYNHKERMLCKVINLSGYVKFLEFSSDGTRVLATDSNGIIYIINYQTGTIIKTYTPLETFGVTSEGYNISDICVDGNTGFVVCKEQLISINLTDGSINWRYTNDSTDVFFNEIANNSDSKNIVISGGSHPIAISKSTGAVSSSFEEDKEHPYGSSHDYSYLSSDNKLYVADTGSKSITTYNINDNSKRQYTLDIPDKCVILSMAENENCIFLNLKTTYSYVGSVNALLICFNKSDMSVKWTTNYTGDYLSEYDLNQVFEFTHVIKNDTGEHYDTTGIVVVSGTNILAFDKQTGKNYFKATQAYEDQLLYCEPTEKYNLKIATSKLFSNNALLYQGEGVENPVVSSEDFLWITNWYNFDKSRKYVASSEGDKFALASENSSEISLYYYYKDSNYTLLNELSETEFLSLDQCVDNGNGILAGSYYRYQDERKDYIILYDVNNNKLLAHEQLSKDVKQMCFIGTDTLFVIDSHGYATALKTDGSVIAEGNIHPLICKAIGVPETTYLSSFETHLSPTKNGVLYCIGDGIFEITVSNNAFSANKILYNKSLSEYHISNDFFSFVKEDYKNATCQIIYFKDGDSEISYVQENGVDVVFKQDSISSVINNKNYEIAFISKEGYIGLYRYGDDKISKMLLPQGEVFPIKILFTPDSKYIIAMCSNGDFVKYSTETLKEVDRYKSTLIIDSYSEFEFVDETTFMAKPYSSSTNIILVDSSTMDLKAEMQNFVYFMPKDRKILFNISIDNKNSLGYYNYLSQKELVDFANNFLNKIGG